MLEIGKFYKNRDEQTVFIKSYHHGLHDKSTFVGQVEGSTFYWLANGKFCRGNYEHPHRMDLIFSKNVAIKEAIILNNNKYLLELNL